VYVLARAVEYAVARTRGIAVDEKMAVALGPQ
jgi:hypothetical protein